MHPPGDQIYINYMYSTEVQTLGVVVYIGQISSEEEYHAGSKDYNYYMNCIFSNSYQKRTAKSGKGIHVVYV